MIVDTSAALCIILNEPEATTYAEVMRDNRTRLVMSPVNHWELHAWIARKADSVSAEALAGFDALFAMPLVPIDAVQAKVAVEAHRRYGRGNHPAGLNMGDCFAYALAKTRSEPLLFKGDDFRKTDVKAAL